MNPSQPSPRSSGSTRGGSHGPGSASRPPGPSGSSGFGSSSSGLGSGSGGAGRVGPGVGRVVGGYELVEELGRGSMGAVFLARRGGLQRLFAVKLLRTDVQPDPEEVARFRLEAAVGSKLQHPGIVGVYDVGWEAGCHFLAMEYCPGPTLRDRLRQGRLPPAEAGALVRDLAQAMAVAHAGGVLHRDLKPSNVILDEATGRARITDFGLARDRGLQRTLTRTGQVLGTPSYMAPEQMRGDKGVDARADVYSLGVILYHCLTGERPYRGRSLVELLKKIVEGDVERPTALAPDVPRALEAVCLRAMAAEPKDRHADAAALAEALDAALMGRGSSGARRRGLVAGLTAVALLGVGLGWGIGRSDPEPRGGSAARGRDAEPLRSGAARAEPRGGSAPQESGAEGGAEPQAEREEGEAKGASPEESPGAEQARQDEEPPAPPTPPPPELTADEEKRLRWLAEHAAPHWFDDEQGSVMLDHSTRYLEGDRRLLELAPLLPDHGAAVFISASRAFMDRHHDAHRARRELLRAATLEPALSFRALSRVAQISFALGFERAAVVFEERSVVRQPQEEGAASARYLARLYTAAAPPVRDWGRAEELLEDDLANLGPERGRAYSALYVARDPESVEEFDATLRIYLASLRLAEPDEARRLLGEAEELLERARRQGAPATKIEAQLSMLGYYRTLARRGLTSAEHVLKPVSFLAPATPFLKRVEELDQRVRRDARGVSQAFFRLAGEQEQERPELAALAFLRAARNRLWDLRPGERETQVRGDLRRAASLDLAGAPDTRALVCRRLARHLLEEAPQEPAAALELALVAAGPPEEGTFDPRLADERADAWVLAARAHAALGDREAARAALDEAEALEPLDRRELEAVREELAR